jgi:hypothetical protein
MTKKEYILNISATNYLSRINCKNIDKDQSINDLTNFFGIIKKKGYVISRDHFACTDNFEIFKIADESNWIVHTFTKQQTNSESYYMHHFVVHSNSWNEFNKVKQTLDNFFDSKKYEHFCSEDKK